MRFGATFYVTSDSDWLGIPDRDDWRLSWAQVRELEKDGFEIGNHSFTHANIVPLSREEATGEIAGCERTFREQGLRKPTTFAYPGATYNRTSMELLKEHGYRFARRGHFPEYANLAYGGRGPAYDPKKHHPLLIPTTLMPGPGTGWEDFVWAMEQARDGKICVFTFHGTPDRYPLCSTPPDTFRRYMNYLKDQGCTVITMRDLVKSMSTPRRTRRKKVLTKPSLLAWEFLPLDSRVNMPTIRWGSMYRSQDSAGRWSRPAETSCRRLTRYWLPVAVKNSLRTSAIFGTAAGWPRTVRSMFPIRAAC